MKMILPLCLIVALAGCSQEKEPGVKPVGSMDSPIIISDGSTHLKHKGSGSDFQITYNGSTDPVIVNDTGYMVGKGQCVSGVSNCPSSFTKQLVAAWTLDVYDEDNGNNKTMTVGSPDNKMILTYYYGNPIDPKADKSGDTAGTDLVQHDWDFDYAVFTNGDGSAPVTITCTSTPCKLKIHYSN
jgi:hypothetical protein